MRAAHLCIGLLTIAVALAGCSDGDPKASTPLPPTDTVPTLTAGGSGSGGSGGGSGSGSGGSGSGGPGTGGNNAPTATLSANATSGNVPLSVMFTLTGDDGDGDELRWTIDADGDGISEADGSDLPAAYNHTFTAPGDFTAMATVTDGLDTTNATATVSVAAPGGSSMEPLTFTGTATGVYDPVLGGPVTGEPILHTFTMPVLATTATFLLAWMPGAPGGDLDMYIFDMADTERGRSACSNFDPVPSPLSSCNRGADEEAVIEGITTADAGTWTVQINPYTSPQLDYTLTITFA